MPVSIILADDHPVVRRGIQALLERERDFSIVGVAADGLEALRILRERSPRTRIVILSFHSSNAFITQALRDGAVGYVVKGSPEQDLIRAVREASAGGHFLGPPS